MEPLVLERAQHPVSRRDIDPHVLRVLYRLIDAGHVAYLVGGSVRDLMLRRQPKDFDVGTSALPHEVRALFRNSRLIGRRFRLVHVFFAAKNIEVATFRRLTEPESGIDVDPMIRQDNTFGTPEEDALRRDFTVNSLFYDPRTFRVIDYVGGLPDLEARLIRTVGDPEVRIREDPVRMIRAVRFAAKLDFEIEPATRSAIERYRGDLLKASVPRVTEEIHRTFGVSNSKRALILFEQLGLLEVLLPSLSALLQTHAGPLDRSTSARNLEALSKALSRGFESSRAFTMAVLFADLHQANARLAQPEPDLAGELKSRGFARADVERMRLLLDAFNRLLYPGRRARALLRRPYFEEVRQLYELLAPHYPHQPNGLELLIAGPRQGDAPARFRPRRRPRRGRRRDRRPETVAEVAPEPVAARSDGGGSID